MEIHVHRRPHETSDLTEAYKRVDGVSVPQISQKHVFVALGACLRYVVQILCTWQLTKPCTASAIFVESPENLQW